MDPKIYGYVNFGQRSSQSLQEIVSALNINGLQYIPLIRHHIIFFFKSNRGVCQSQVYDFCRSFLTELKLGPHDSKQLIPILQCVINKYRNCQFEEKVSRNTQF